MKLNAKIIIPAFALLAGASLVGSISGTVAWYQYSTRANVSYIGSSAGVIGNLQVRLAGGEWGPQVSTDDVLDYLGAQHVEPVTPGNLGKDESLKEAKWNEGVAVASGDDFPDAPNEGDYFFKAGVLYVRGASEWENSGIAVAANAPTSPNAASKYFNSVSKKLFERVTEAKWNDGSAVVKSGDAFPTQSNEGDYFFKEGVLYVKGASEWADSGIAVAAAAPASPAVGDKYFNSNDKRIYERVIGNVLQEKNFYVNPQFGVGPYSKWLKASAANYVKIPLQLRFIEGDEQHLTAQEVYLSKLLIQKDTGRDADYADHGDISDAVRVHFSVYEEGDEENAVNRLVSKKGGTTLTHGKLKLGGGADFDKAYDADDEWGFNGSSYTYVDYGAGSQVSYIADDEDGEGYIYDEECPASGWKQIALRTGDGEPAADLGENGEFYFNTAENGKLYKKAAGAWAEFGDALSGANNPALTDIDDTHDYFFKTGENKLFKRGASHEDISSILVSQSTNPNKPLELENTAGKSLGQTIVTDDPQHYLNVDVTIWVEGWQQFERGGKQTSMWDRNLIGAMFDVGIQFAVQDLNA